MKKILITFAILITALPVLADGPDTHTVAGTTGGVVWVLQDPLLTTPQRTVYVSCVDDDFTMLVERYSTNSGWYTVRFGTSIQSPDATISVWQNQIVPVIGKFDRITFTTVTGNANIQVMAYTE